MEKVKLKINLKKKKSWAIEGTRIKWTYQTVGFISLQTDKFIEEFTRFDDNLPFERYNKTMGFKEY